MCGCMSTIWWGWGSYSEFQPWQLRWQDYKYKPGQQPHTFYQDCKIFLPRLLLRTRGPQVSTEIPVRFTQCLKHLSSHNTVFSWVFPSFSVFQRLSEAHLSSVVWTLPPVYHRHFAKVNRFLWLFKKPALKWKVLMLANCSINQKFDIVIVYHCWWL